MGKRSDDGFMQMRICMMSPPSIRGLAYLVHEREAGHNVWGYFPGEERVLRIRSKTAANRARIARTDWISMAADFLLATRWQKTTMGAEVRRTASMER